MILINRESSQPLIAILLCTYNGAKFLAEQLNSLEAQIYENWYLVVSDDGSTDETLAILRQYQKSWPEGKLILRKGPQKGFCGNFLSLACDPSIRADYFAFCDQDDVWLATKLQVAIEYFQVNERDELARVYCGRTAYVKENLKPCGNSPLFVFPRNFRNALVQSIAGGNTMVFNLASKKLLEQTGPVTVPCHDWWIYLLVTGAGGEVFYDPKPQLLYRQHRLAAIGRNDSLFSRVKRIWRIALGRFQSSNTQHILALNQVSNLLTASHKETLKLFESLRGARFKDRFRLMEVCGLYRQTRRGTLSLMLATLLKRV